MKAYRGFNLRKNLNTFNYFIFIWKAKPVVLFNQKSRF